MTPAATGASIQTHSSRREGQLNTQTSKPSSISTTLLIHIPIEKQFSYKFTPSATLEGVIQYTYNETNPPHNHLPTHIITPWSPSIYTVTPSDILSRITPYLTHSDIQ